ncbi:MAG: DsrE family protein [Nitrospirota bacterium]
MNIGFLVCSSPESQDGFTVGRLAGEFLSAGHQVSLFFMDDGVYHAAKGAGSHSKLALERLVEQGAKAALCAVTAKARALEQAHLYPSVEWSSQYELAQMVKKADRFLAFG